MPSYDATSARCAVFTFKEGLLSAVAHDLELEVGRFTVEVSDDGASIRARFEAGSLRVVEPIVDGRRAPGTLSDKDKRKIEENLRDDVLHAKRHPEIVFESTEVTDTRVVGRLTMNGATREVRCTRDGERASATLHQPDWGIKPYSAMLGTLKIKPDVRVELALTR
ncbi:MAG: YceI family protein [Sandaracinaceae bacterium]|nr:YceI family protein [Sandaracinaceae bacterium]